MHDDPFQLARAKMRLVNKADLRHGGFVQPPRKRSSRCNVRPRKWVGRISRTDKPMRYAIFRERLTGLFQQLSPGHNENAASAFSHCGVDHGACQNSFARSGRGLHQDGLMPSHSLPRSVDQVLLVGVKLDAGHSITPWSRYT